MEKPVAFKNLQVGKTYRFKFAGKEKVGILEAHNTRLNIHSRLPFSLFIDTADNRTHLHSADPRQTFYEQVSEEKPSTNSEKKPFSLTKAMKTLKRGLENRKMDPQGGKRKTRKTRRKGTYRKRR